MGFATNNFIILLGPIIAHVSIGYARTITPTYVAKLSPASYRGCFTSFPEVFINAGITLGYACNYIFSHNNFNGVQSETLTTIKKDQELADKHVDRLTLNLHIFTLLGSVFAGWTAYRISRQLTIFLVGFIFFIGPLFMGFASNNFIILLGRIIAHVEVGYALTMTPIYVAEVSLASYSGCFTSFPEVFINVGIALGYACNYMFSMINFNGWCLMLCEGAISLVLLAISWYSPCRNPPDGSSCEESCSKRSASSPRSPPPRRKLNSNFKNIKAAAGIPPEWNDDVVIVPSIGEGVWQDILRHPSPSLRYTLLCAILIQLFQKAFGIDIILLYIARFLEKAGFMSSDKKILLTILVEVAKTICILVATLLLDKLRRRLLLLSSIGGMFVSLVILRTCLVKID
ncbi:putative polyol transporter 2 [Syzygium oleosum]|uniref:putative polyol transporter 2 n=1 Tax=Syzygium oleosum TaxID=219896 RepID=UPI0024BA9819|nr:putative polyol transporter 2 [Syzygium oleosum]